MLEKIVITSLCITLIHVSGEEGMILFKVRQWLDKHIPAWLQPPLYKCPICMCSFWGTLFFFWFAGAHTVYTWFVFVLAVGGVNTVIHAFINHSIKEKEPLPAELVDKVEAILKHSTGLKNEIISDLYEYCKRN